MLPVLKLLLVVVSLPLIQRQTVALVPGTPVIWIAPLPQIGLLPFTVGTSGIGLMVAMTERELLLSQPVSLLYDLQVKVVVSSKLAISKEVPS